MNKQAPCFRKLLLPLGLSVVLSCVLTAQEPVFLGNFSQFNYGEDQKLPAEVGAYIRENLKDAAALAALSSALQTKAATEDGFNLACVTLGEIGGDKDVGFLAAQLAKPAVFDSARTALQRLATPAATKSLMDFTAGPGDDAQLSTVLLALGRIGSPEAVPLLIEKSAEPSLLVRTAAFEALARIANPAAVAAISKATPKGNDGSAAGMMQLAAVLAARGDKKEAAALCQIILAATELPAGLLESSMRLMISKDLPGSSELLARLASAPQAADNPIVLENFARLPAGTQAMILEGISKTANPHQAVQRMRLIGDSFPLAPLMELLTSPSEGIRFAAIPIFSRNAGASDFEKLLAAYLATPPGDARSEQLRLALLALSSSADDWLAQALSEAASPAQQLAIIAVVKERRVHAAAEALLAASSSTDPAVHAAALDALATIGAPGQAGRLLEMLLAAQSPVDRRDLAKALALSLRRSPDKAAVITEMSSKLSSISDPALKDALIDLMGKSGEPACLPILFAEFEKSDKARRTLILRAVSNWADEGPLDQLAIYAASDPDAASRIFSLRAFLDILARSPGLSDDTHLQRLWQAYLLATRVEEHRGIISQAATVRLPAARMLLGSYRFDPELRRELAAANKAHDALLAGPQKKVVDPDDTAPPIEDGSAGQALAESKKTKYPANPFDTPGAFEKWEDPLGFSGRWVGGGAVLDLVQLPQQTFQGLLTTSPGTEPKKVLGLLGRDNVLQLHAQGASGTMSADRRELIIDGKSVPLTRQPVGKVGAFPRPATAKVVFDGKSLDGFRKTKSKLLGDDAVEMPAGAGSLVSNEAVADARVYVEFRMPFNPESLGPRRGNSGIYLMSTYEVQLQDGFGMLLDTEGAEPADRSCGSIYGIAAPRLNACAPPLEWQSMLVEFRAPKFGPDGVKTQNAKMSVWHNGVLVQDQVDVPRPTGGDAEGSEKKGEPDKPMPLLLQNHGNTLQFRNIWIEPLS